MIGILGTVAAQVFTRRVAAVAVQTAFTAAVAAAVSSGVVDFDAVCGGIVSAQ